MIKKIGLVLLGLFILVGVMSVLGGSSTDTQVGDGGSTGGSTEAPVEVAESQVGTAVRDGSFEFVVTSIDCSQSTVGKGAFKSTANGVYCVVNVTVENIGTEAGMFDADSQYLYDGEGRQFGGSSDALYAFVDTNAFLEDVNPGIKIEAILLFDIPVDAVPAYLELHDSVFSGGVKVTI